MDLDEVSVFSVLVAPPFRCSASWMIYLVILEKDQIRIDHGVINDIVLADILLRSWGPRTSKGSLGVC